MLKWWLVWRYLSSGRRFFNLTSALSIIGLGIGVAALVVAMAVISGFKMTLKESVIDVFGDVVVAKSMNSQQEMKEAEKEMKELIGQINKDRELRSKLSGELKLLSLTPYETVEGVVVHKSKISGVILQGLDPLNYASVLNLNSRMVKGHLNLSTNNGVTGVVVGQTMAKKFNLSVGDSLRVVVPIIEGYGSQSFRSKIKTLKVTGILTFGRYEYDLRNILIDLRELQDFVELGDRISGMRLNIQNPDNAMILSQAITSQLGHRGYWAMNWRQVNNNLFAAIDYEQVIIFLILMIIVVAASFNVASTLFVSVLRRFRDMSTLQAMGMTRSMVKSMFVIQGLIIGVMGYVLGVCLGLLAGGVFVYVHKEYGLLSGEVYKLEGLELNIRSFDLFLIFITCLGICYLSTLGPSSKGGALSVVDGLKYE